MFKGNVKSQAEACVTIQEIRKFPVIDASVNLSKVPEKAVIEVEPLKHVIINLSSF